MKKYWIAEKIVSAHVVAETEHEAVMKLLQLEKEGLISLETRAFEEEVESPNTAQLDMEDRFRDEPSMDEFERGFK